MCSVRLQCDPYTICAPAQVEEVDGLVDPCPLPSMLKKRGLNEKERLLYAPMADVGGLLYDKDAVYIDIPDWKVNPLLTLLQLLIRCAA